MRKAFYWQNLKFNKLLYNNFRIVQWLRLCAPNVGFRVQSLVGELRWHMTHSVAKKKKKKLKRIDTCICINESLFWTPETNNIGNWIYSKENLKKNFNWKETQKAQVTLNQRFNSILLWLFNKKFMDLGSYMGKSDLRRVHTLYIHSFIEIKIHHLISGACRM